MADFTDSVLEAALRSIDKEKQYIDTKHSIELLAKDELERRLNLAISSIQADNELLNKQLQCAKDGTERLRKMVDEQLAHAQSAEAMLEELQREKRCREHELFRLTSENQSLRDASDNTGAILTQKLALDRELSVLRPEIEHLKAQSSSAERLHKEKLALQRQLSDAQCEIAAAKIEAVESSKRKRPSMVAAEVELEKTKKLLVREQHARESAENAVAHANEELKASDARRELVEEKTRREGLEEELSTAKKDLIRVKKIESELARERATRDKLEKDVERLSTELNQSKQASLRANAEVASDHVNIIADLRQQLEVETQARVALERAELERQQMQSAQSASTENKAEQPRSKANARTKSSRRGQASSVTAEPILAIDFAKTITTAASPFPETKRARAHDHKHDASNPPNPMLDETTLGTPGDGPTATRKRRPAAIVGDKSTFSITPFLNKTSMLDLDNDADLATADGSPSILTSGKLPLMPAASIKTNTHLKRKTGRKEKMESEVLSQVVEEETSPASIDDVVLSKPAEPEEATRNAPANSEQQPSSDKQHIGEEESKPQVVHQTDETESNKENTNNAEKTKKQPVLRMKQKARKSLTDFKSFQIDEEKPVIKSKKRKLGGRGPTLFDTEDDTAQDVFKSGVKGNLFGASAYARLASAKKGAAMAKTPSLVRSGLSSAIDGSTSMQFSPLKRHRKNLDDTLRG